jgi:hypothetical protein
LASVYSGGWKQRGPGVMTVACLPLPGHISPSSVNYTCATPLHNSKKRNLFTPALSRVYPPRPYSLQRYAPSMMRCVERSSGTLRCSCLKFKVLTGPRPTSLLILLCDVPLPSPHSDAINSLGNHPLSFEFIFPLGMFNNLKVRCLDIILRSPRL